jgi:hypothetical protein
MLSEEDFKDEWMLTGGKQCAEKPTVQLIDIAKPAKKKGAYIPFDYKSSYEWLSSVS